MKKELRIYFPYYYSILKARMYYIIIDTIMWTPTSTNFIMELTAFMKN